ncbi:MAG: DNA methyltransferase [Alphaproteobacteria bacterium]
MTPDQFIAKWRASELKERSAAQEHFIDLCRLLDEPTPAEADPKGESFCFEKGATKTTGGDGFADVWKRHHFGWEYKGKRHDLNVAYAQLQQYAVALENPPLLVVCDTERFRIHTNWTNTVSQVHDIALDDLRDANERQKLKWVLSDPERLRPAQTRQALTEQAASEFAALAQRLRARGHQPQTVAHFVNRLVFCMFAEDVDLLPGKMFTRMLDQARTAPERFQEMSAGLFEAMRTGGLVGFEKVAWFNGGLFDDGVSLPLDKDDIDLVLRAARLDWQDIDPSIFGTLFERGLDPDKRSQLGAHYTDPDKIMKIVEPVVVRPLAAEWQAVRARIEAEMAKLAEARARRPARQSSEAARKVYAAARRAEETAHRKALRARDAFLVRLRKFRVLDPACGSGNFLYLALLALKDLEHRALIESEALGLKPPVPSVGPEAVRGIEINAYAAELARVTVWIGEIQWVRRNGFLVPARPVLKPLDTIECRDALINETGTEAPWPAADAIIGNPPFLGCKLMFGVLGQDYTKRMRAAYKGRVSPFADLVCFWFEKARAAIAAGATRHAGLVATNSIRGGKNRLALDRIVADLTIFDAWDDEPWILNGAAVRVSMVCFAPALAVGASKPRLDGVEVDAIHADLTVRKQGGNQVDLTKARHLDANRGVAFVGTVKSGAFDVSGEIARAWLRLPTNPNGRPNSDVLRPWVNGIDVVRRPQDKWIIDFGVDMTMAEAALYEVPFDHVLKHVKPARVKVRRPRYRDFWWLEAEPCAGMRSANGRVGRFCAVPALSKHRLFVWFDARVQPDHQLIAVARENDTTFGVLHSRFHELWSLRLGTSLEDRPRYTPSTTFETFPFPTGLTPNIPPAEYAADPRAQAIAAAARRLNELREAWLNPPDLVRREPEVVPGFPDRLLPVDERAAANLKKRTLTKLYNERPTWLANAHRDLDAAVAAAYGWPADLTDDAVLARLFALNQERAREVS